MNLSCGSRTIKYLIFSFNFFFVLTGIILIAIGASIRAYFVEYDYFLDNQYFSLPNLLIATGALIFFISFLGCYGAMKNSWIMLFAFSVLLGIIFIFEFSAGIAGYVLRDKTSSYLETAMLNSLPQYTKNDNAATGIWDYIQPKFECCGVTGLDDWTRLPNVTGNSLPISCCPHKPGQWGTAACNANPIQTVPTPSTPAPNPSNVQAKANAADSAHIRKRRAVDNSTSDPSPTTVSTVAPSTNGTVAPSTTSTVAPTNASTTITLSTTTVSPVPETTLMPSTTTPYQVGCEEAFGKWVKAHAVDIGAVCFTLAVLQLIGIGFACHLSKQLKNSYYST